MTEMSDFRYIISIDTNTKTVNIATMQWLDNSVHSTIRLPKAAELGEGIILYAAQLMSAKGEIVRKSCYICTDNDIVEISGAGFISFKTLNEAEKYLKKLEKMIEWEI